MRHTDPLPFLSARGGEGLEGFLEMANQDTRLARLATLFILGLFAIVPTTANAQLLSADVEAASGSPWGVGRLNVRLAGDVDLEHIRIEERDGRVMYPVLAQEPVRALVRDLLNLPARRGSIYFLFRGDAPLDLKVAAPGVFQGIVRPRSQRLMHNRLLRQWWDEYQGRAQDTEQEFSVVDNYLVSLLAKQLNLKIEEPRPGLLARLLGSEEESAALDTLFSAPSLRQKLQREAMLAPVAGPVEPTMPLPESVTNLAVEGLPEMPEAKIEDVAAHVPAECFYLRFGTFANFLWMRDLLDEKLQPILGLLGGTGIDRDLQERFEQQLLLRQSILADMLGDYVISDLVFLGDDLFIREGASMGVILESRNNLILGNVLAVLRAEALSKNADAKQELVDIAGHQVFRLSTPDNRVRSFMAVDGNYHLVTTSESLVRRFFATGMKEHQSLAETAGFRRARAELPLDRKDALFVFASEEFFQQLASAQYRVEMQRRLQASTDIELLLLARRAAAAEGREATSIAALVEGGFLPPGFASRADGSQPETYQEATLVDSLRGRRGTFLPVTDVAIEKVTPAEAATYADFSERYERDWQRVGPFAAGIRHRTLKAAEDAPPGQEPDERLAVDVYAEPFTMSTWWIDMLGPPSSQEMVVPPADLVTGELVLNSQHLFGGLRNAVSLETLRRNESVALAPSIKRYLLGYLTEPAAAFASGYLGSKPDAGLLSALGPWSEADAQGYSNNGRQIYRRDLPDAVYMSFQQSLLKEASEETKFVDAERPAQIRLHAGTISDYPQVAELLDTLVKIRARKIARENALLLHRLTDQLRTPPEEAMSLAEELVAGKLVVPLGGEYKLDQQRFPDGVWTAQHAFPEPHAFGPTNWLRDLKFDLLLDDARLTAHVVLDMKGKYAPEAEVKEPAKEAESKPAVSP